MITDNSTAHGMINKTMTPRRSKAINMRFHWLKCREAQRQLRTMWERGSTNLADYFGYVLRHPINKTPQSRLSSNTGAVVWFYILKMILFLS